MNMLLGRERELAMLDRRLSRVGNDSASVFIEGAAGLGKTALVEHVVEACAQQGVRLCSAVADEMQKGRPFGTLLEALRIGHRSESATALRVVDLLASRLDRSIPSLFSVAPDLRSHVIDAICEHVEELAANPLVLVFEDLHSADLSTLMAVVEIRRRLGGFALLIIATSRSVVDASLESSIDNLRRSADDHLVLDPLTEPAVAALVERLIGGRPGPDLGRLITDVGGNPLLLTETLSGLQRDDVLETNPHGIVELVGAPRSTTLASTVMRRMNQLTPEGRDAVRAAAVLGVRFSLGDLSSLTGRRTNHLLPLLREANAAGLINLDAALPAFSHGLVHEAVEVSIPAAGLAALHLDAAELLKHRGAPVALITHHLERSGIADTDDLRRWRITAADEASRREPAVAYGLYSAVLAQTERETDEWLELQLKFLEAAASSGHIDEAEQIGADLLGSTVLDGASRIEVLWWLGSVLLLQNRLERAVEVLDAGATQLSPGPLQARLMAVAALVRAVGCTSDVRPFAERAVAAADDVGDPTARSLASAALARAMAYALDFPAATHMSAHAIAFAADDPTGLAARFQPAALCVMNNFDIDDLAGARALVAEGRRSVDQIGSLWADSFFSFQAGLIAYDELRIDDALAESAAGLAGAESAGVQMPMAWLHSLEALAAARSGQFDRASAALDRAMACMADCRFLGIDLATLAEVIIREGNGDGDAAFEHLADMWMGLDDAHLHGTTFVLTVPLLGRAVERGRADVVSRVGGRTAFYAERTQSARFLGSSLLAEVALGNAPPSTLPDAVAAIRRSEHLMDRADLLAVAASLASRGSASISLLAGEWLDEAHDFFDRGQLAADLARVKSVRGRLGKTSRRRPTVRATSGWESLTPTERAVALRLTDGGSNKTIARDLGVSVRTVESHVSRILAKLGVQSRLQIALIVGTHREPDAPAEIG